MRSMLDSEFDDMHGVEVFQGVDPFCLEVDARDTTESESADCDSVWLECNGELADVGAVKLLGVRKSACGFETLLFICPRCSEPHESVRFG